MSNIQPPTTRTGRAADVLEWFAGLAIRLGRNGMLLVLPTFIGYVFLGGVLTWAGMVVLPYPFLSIASDPVFNLLGFAAGLTIVSGSLGLLILLLMNDLQRVGNQVALLLLGISFGSCVALLRHTYETALATVLAIVRLFVAFAGLV